MALRDDQLAARYDNAVEFRPSPVRVRWTFDDLAAGDGHRLTCAFSCSVRALPADAERRLFEEVLLAGRDSATLADLTAHFAPALRAAVATLAGRHPAARWLDSARYRDEWVQALRSAGERLAFTCGVELLAPFHVDLASPSLERDRIEQMQRLASQRHLQHQMEHLDRAADLLERFSQLRQAAPGLSPGDLLRQISPADQGAMLQNLLMAAAQQHPTRSLWAVAGLYLACVDAPAVLAQPPGAPVSDSALNLIVLPSALGPLRSVQHAPGKSGGRLLVGARNGVFDVSAGDPEQPLAYADRHLDSPHGFSRVLICAGRLWACHRDGGLVAWTLGQTAQPARTLRPAAWSGGGAGNLTALDDSRLLFSVDNRLLSLDASAASPAAQPVDSPGDAPLLAILPAANHILIVQDDGLVTLRDRVTLEVLDRRRPAGRLSAAALLPWLGRERLLLADADGPVTCVGLDDPVVTQYSAFAAGLRQLSAAADLVAALSPDRQSIVLWHSWDGRRPAAEIRLSARTRHRVADIEIG